MRPLRRFGGFHRVLEHEVDHHGDGAPVNDVFVPEEHFADVEEGDDAEEGKGDDRIPDNGDPDGRIGPQGQARKIQDHGKDGNFRAGAGGHEDLNEPDEDHGGAHHLHGHFHLQGFVRFLGPRPHPGAAVPRGCRVPAAWAGRAVRERGKGQAVPSRVSYVTT